MPKVFCKLCDNMFYIRPSHQRMGEGLYCSILCRSKAQMTGKVFKCFNCKKQNYKSISQQKHSKSGKYFCSKKCQTHWRNTFFSGEKHANWKGGTGIYRKLLIKSKHEMKCVICGIQNKVILTAHHIDHNRNNNKLSNLTWLCMNCHYLVHHNEKLDQKIKGNKLA